MYFIPSSLGVAYINDSKDPLQIIISILVAVFSLIALLSYKKRKIQLRWCYVVIGLLVAFSLAIVIDLKSVCQVIRERESFIPDTVGLPITLRICLPVLAIFLDIFAIVGIKKDEKLVRSLDRLR
jgi:hypothetical protein